MTLQEFDKMKWHGGIKCKYGEEYCYIGGINLHERLIGLILDPDKEIFWARCENVELVESRHDYH